MPVTFTDDEAEFRRAAYELVERELREMDICEVTPWRSPFCLGDGTGPVQTTVTVRGESEPHLRDTSAMTLLECVDELRRAAGK